jgi:hypothetical protein
LVLAWVFAERSSIANAKTLAFCVYKRIVHIVTCVQVPHISCNSLTANKTSRVYTKFFFGQPLCDLMERLRDLS